MKTKDLEIEWEGKKEVVTIKSMTSKSSGEILNKCIKYKPVGNIVINWVDYVIKKRELMKNGISKAPFQLDDKSLDGLDTKIADYISTEIEKFNTLDVEKKGK